MNRLIVTLAIYAGGAWLIWRWAGWQVTLGVFLLLWAKSIESKMK